VKRWLGLFGVIVVTAVVTFLWWRSIRPAESELRYQRIQLGMSQESVINVFGRDCDWDVSAMGGRVHPSQPSPAHLVGWLFAREAGEDFILVGFDSNGRVVGKELRCERARISDPPMFRHKLP
jgi:hypothetical protein